jgi:hypothetical protein
MKLRKFTSGRVELAVCLVVPLLVLAALAIPGHLYVRRLEQSLLERTACLERVPEMERKLVEARQVLRPFAVASAEGDKGSELTLTVEKAAQSFGFTTRSADVEKKSGTGAQAWSDYKVTLNGVGSLKSIIGMLDFLEHPSRRFQVNQVTLNAKGFVPEATYEGEVVLTSRTVDPSPDTGGSGSVPKLTAAQGAERVVRLGQLTALVRLWSEEARSPLVIALKSEPRKEVERLEQRRPTSLFVLNGIIRGHKHPLAMTDRGLFGVGEEVDGYKILSIADDQVVVQGKSGPPETVKLYSEKKPSDEQDQDTRDDVPHPQVE